MANIRQVFRKRNRFNKRKEKIDQLDQVIQEKRTVLSLILINLLQNIKPPRYKDRDIVQVELDLMHIDQRIGASYTEGIIDGEANPQMVEGSDPYNYYAEYQYNIILEDNGHLHAVSEERIIPKSSN